ncbi:uncharacterized protein MELLADRAFT_92508 [Melampsora larici-populina 98AG31]|uniref:Secreted protein n=1 Tax=Melampsora larici-populina (strain 98AG31 / pathotype 3-4-7) TaxID=747676 RepID=F4R8Q2_MELLP|nr:uncharacterized protein MELLADRAFT_92508 [Melampsora larici-populina 98AG31]EGG11077.1 hypothetical protein MELLADRAFT_92508 [Melampsora larici-populina 98AG31]
MQLNVATIIASVVLLGLLDTMHSTSASAGISRKMLSRRNPQDASKPSAPVSLGSDNLSNDVDDASSTQYSNYTSYAHPDDHYANGTRKSSTPSAPQKVDTSGDYSALYPPPPSLSLPPFSGIPYPLPLTGVKKHCPPRKKDDGMTVALPSDLYTGKITKCGQRVVVIFENLAGQKWTGPKNNLTLTVVDAFDTNDRTEIGRTVLLSEVAWKEATGNSIINKFESWPIRWFFLDSAMQHETAEGAHENTNGEEDGGSSGNSTMYYQGGSGNATTSSSYSGNGTKSDYHAESVDSPEQQDAAQHRPPPEKDFDPVPDTTKTRPQNKRNLLSRRSSKSYLRQQTLKLN